jgi:hypothetical protein
MTLTATVNADVRATDFSTSGLASSASDNSISFAFDAGDCTKVFSDRRSFPSIGYEDIDLAAAGMSVVKLLCVKNLSSSASMALAAGWTGSQFSVFRQDVTAWNFSPMINLGNLTLRGYPIRQGGAFLLSCPNSDGFATTVGGSVLRIGGTSGQQYEIYVMGT